MQKKILLVSHNVLSKTSNMGKTLAAFFEGYDSENIAQLYFHSEIPTLHICEKYYNITDFDIVHGLLKRKCCGRKYTKSDISESAKTERIDTRLAASIYSKGRKRKPYMYLGRNMLWRISKNKLKEMYDWVKEFSPDIVFFASGDYVFPYEIVNKISHELNIPVVSYVCDDFYLIDKKSISPLYWLHRRWFKKTAKELFSESAILITICEKLGKKYQELFGTPYKTLMTGSMLRPKKVSQKNMQPVISYIGNLGYDRWKPLVEIGQILRKRGLFLNIYSSEQREEILSHLSENNGIVFHGNQSFEKVREIMYHSDILIHVESMEKHIRMKIAYSISTKIADSLACGTCLFAYGPPDVASIEYLKENDAACVVTEQNTLERELLSLIGEEGRREYYVQNAIALYRKNHNSGKNQMLLKSIIQQL